MSVTYSNKLPWNSKDVAYLKKQYREFYKRHYPLLTYRSLSEVKSQVDDFYNETTTEQRGYDDFQIHIIPPNSTGKTFEQGYWGIDTERSDAVFVVCVPILEVESISPKPGDIIQWAGRDHEVLAVKNKEDSLFAHSNYYFELLVATYVPNIGS